MQGKRGCILFCPAFFPSHYNGLGGNACPDVPASNEKNEKFRGGTSNKPCEADALPAENGKI